MLWVDIALALLVALLMSWAFIRFVDERGPWRRPWLFGVTVFLLAWAAGAWIAPELESGWLTYWIPFVLAGLISAVLIVAVSPEHTLETPEDAEQFEREVTAVLLSVSVFWWMLGALLVAAVVMAYLR